MLIPDNDPTGRIPLSSSLRASQYAFHSCELLPPAAAGATLDVLADNPLSKGVRAAVEVALLSESAGIVAAR